MPGAQVTDTGALGARDRQRLRAGPGGQDAPTVAEGLTIGEGNYPAASIELLGPGLEPHFNGVVAIEASVLETQDVLF